MRGRIWAALLIAIVAYPAVPAAAAGDEPRLVLGPETAIRFEVGLFGIFSIEGGFTRFTGEIRLGGPEPEDDIIECTVETASAFTDDGDWLDTLRGPDFFDTARFPALSFRSGAIRRTGEGHLRIEGLLTLRGQTRPFALDAEYTPETGPEGEVVVLHRFRAEGTLSRAEFGMTAYGGVVGDDVIIAIEGGPLVPAGATP